MNALRNLVHEIHRRSIWQVLGIFLAASWGVLQVVEVLTETAGLPDWTPTMALVLLLIGLPICVATAFVQEGMPGRDDVGPGGGGDSSPSEAGSIGPEGTPGRVADAAQAEERDGRARSTGFSATGRLLTWRNAVLGGIGAFALLGFSLIAYFIMWTTGIGPVGNLQAQGLLDEGEPVLLADFDNNTADAALGDIVTEALRVDLATAQTIALVEVSSVEDILGRMGRPADDPVRGAVAEEVATRGGYRAVIEGEVGSAGAGYILVARIRSITDGQTLATFRRTASNENEVIPAIDGLSQDIRERAGESLRSIRAGEPLEAVTTSSLEALRLYTEANEVREGGDPGRARALLEEALRLDPEFAMAWRSLAIVLSDTGGTRSAQREAATRAYELRHRLTDRERYKAVAQYHRDVTGDVFEEIAAYESLLDRYPDDDTGLNNLSIAYSDLGRWEDAAELLRRAIEGPGSSQSAYINRVLYATLGGDFPAAEQAWEDLDARTDDRELWRNWTAFVLRFSEWDGQGAIPFAVALQNLPDSPNWRRTGTRAVALSHAVEGEIETAREVFAGAATEARRQDSARDVFQTSVDQARAELWGGSGDGRSVLERALASGIMDEIPPAERSNFYWITLLAWTGLEDEARRMLSEWEVDAGDLVADQSAIVTQFVDAVALGRDDPTAGAAALDRLRNTTQCTRCWMWEVGTFLEEAGRIDEAIRERERSLEAGQDFFFGLHRLAAHESLGRLYEQKGDTAKAVEHYRVYVDQLQAGAASLPRVRRAQERLTALGAAR
jgi:tetratricopeptide (TPR) repeat protein